jgi:myo-inositol catabolism protein IolC
MEQLQDAGVDPAIWAFEPSDDETFTEAAAAQAHLDDRISIVLLVVSGELAAGQIGGSLTEAEKRVIRTAARTHGVTGVLIGPGAYFRHLVQFNEGIIEREEAVDIIASHLGDIGEIFEKSRSTSEVL